MREENNDLEVEFKTDVPEKPKRILGMQLSEASENITLGEEAKIECIIEKFNMQDINPILSKQRIALT